MSRRTFLGVSTAAIGGAMIGCGGGGEEGGSSGGGSLPESVRIGALVAASGPAAAFGQSALNSMRLAAEEWNGRGGLYGNRRGIIELEVVDDRSTPAQAVQGVARLARDAKILTVMAVEPSPATLQASVEAERQRFPYMNVASIESTVNTRGLKNTVTTSSTANTFLETYVKSMRTLLEAANVRPERVALVYENQIVGPVYKRRWDEVGAELAGDWNVVGEFGYNPTSQDLTPLVSQLKDAKVDLPLTIAYVQDSILLVKAMRTLDYVPLAISGAAGGFETEEFGKALGKQANFVIGAGYFSPDLNTPECERFVAAYRKQFKSAPDGVAASAYVGAYSLFTALRRDRVTERDGVVPAMKKLDLKVGDPGIVIPNGVKITETGANEAAIPVVFQWNDGEKQALLPEELATAKPTIPHPPWSETV